MPSRIFITGISGLLGLNCAFRWRESHDVSGVYREHPVAIDGVEAGPLDLLDADAVRRRVNEIGPALIVHTAGFTSVDGCERDPAQARRIHEDATRNVAVAAREAGAGLIHISTDHLFSGMRPMLDEDEEPAPLNVYAATKLAAEGVVAESKVEALIARTNFYGWGTRRRASLTDWILTALEHGQPREMFTDVFFTPIQINDLADALLDLWRTSARGVVNVVGRERLSKYAFGLQVADRFGFDAELIVPRSVSTFPFSAPRPLDMSLSAARAAAVLGHSLPDVASGLTRLAAERAAGLPAALERAASPPGGGFPHLNIR